MKNIPFVIPFLLLFILGSCKHIDRQNKEVVQQHLPPLIVSTTLADTLSPEIVRQLQTVNVTGLKVKYATGQHVSYFEYDADRNTVLKVISNLPFSRHSPRADTTCRIIPNESIQMLRSMVSIEEQETGIVFWEASDADVYECLKAPFRHILVMRKNSHRILHRIEYTG